MEDADDGAHRRVPATTHRLPPSTVQPTQRCMQRLTADLRNFIRDPPTDISASPDGDDLLHWTAIILGPRDSPWEGAVLRLRLEFPPTYPHDPPRVSFAHRMYHPNVYGDGRLCLDLLKAQWSPTLDVAALLVSVQSLLTDPNPMSAANPEAAQCYAQRRETYDAIVAGIAKETKEMGM